MKYIDKSILLVEDDPIIALSQKRDLLKHGYTVFHTSTGEKAVEFIKLDSQKIDLILMDIDLGKGIDGTQAAREILKLKEIPIVFLSSHTESEIVEKTESITSYGYVVKNSGITVLDASIKMAFKLFEAHKNVLKHKINEEKANVNLKKTNANLKIVNKNLSRLDRAIENTKDIVLITDISGLITYINPQFTKTYGYTQEEVLGKLNPRILNAGIISDKEDSSFWKGLQDQTNFHTEFLNKSKNGKPITVEASIDPIFNDNGEIIEFVQIHRDITDQLLTKENEIKKTNYLNFLNTISKEQANTSNFNDLTELITKQLEKITNPIFVSFSEYDSNNKVLRKLDIRAEEPIINRGIQIAGKKIFEIKVPVNDEYYKEITTKTIKVFHSLHETTHGAVTKKISFAIHKALKIDKLWRLFYVIDNKLYGGSLFALKKGQIKPDKELLESFITITSISLRRLDLESKTTLSEIRFRDIFEQSIMGIYRTTPEGEILIANSAIIKMLGYNSFEEIKNWDLNGSDFEPDYERSEFIKTMEKDNKITGREAVWTKRDGTKLYVRESAMTIRNEDGKVMYYQGMVEDISEQKQIKKELVQVENESKNYLDAITSMDLGLFIVNEDYSIRYMNDTMIKWFGDQTNLICYKAVGGLADPCPYCRLKEVINTGENVIYTPTTEDGRIFNIHGSLLKNSDGTVSKLEIIQDITELTTAHKHVETLLEDKEIILKEVHHRIKNNMMTIMGLLTFQEQAITDKKSIDAFEDTRNRVQSMMVLYEKLYKSSNYQSVWIKDYFETLLEEIIDGFPRKENVHMIYDIENIKMEPKIVFNLGIIINELITNSMKYAVGNKKNELYVSASLSNNFLTFTIKDNGKGFPDKEIQNTSEGYGLKLVQILVEQLSAKISFSNDNGAKVIIILNMEDQ